MTNEPTARQRSAFSDAVDIINELERLGIPPKKMIEAMEHSLAEYKVATNYMNHVYFTKWEEEKGTQDD